MKKKRQLKYLHDTHYHKDCMHAIPCRDAHVSNLGLPILGRCPHKEHMFILTEMTRCEHFKKSE